MARTNTYIVINGALALRNHHPVRDILRSDADLRDEYAAVKQRIGAAVANISEYGRGKNAMLQKIMTAAGVAKEERAAIDAYQFPTQR